MRLRNLLLAMATLAGAGTVSVPVSQAASGFLALPAAIPALVLSQQGCRASLEPALGGFPAPHSSSSAKASALLGGKMSKLDLIASQQAATSGMSSGHTARLASAPALPGQGVEPGAGINCVAFAGAAASIRGFAPGLRNEAAGADDFLASRRLTVARTAFDGAWSRVRSGNVPVAVVKPMTGLSARSRLASVNAWANNHIRYVEDQDQYGSADYWAPASATINARAGDCEDIAIVKMQMLASLGIARSDMFLTVARDRVRNRDHALLIVKADGQFWMLDNATNAVLDASQNHDYMPILTFSEKAKWLHGF